MLLNSFASFYDRLINGLLICQAYDQDKESVDFLADPIVTKKLANTQKLSKVNVDEYDAIYYVGGHGPVIDLPQDLDNIKLVSQVRY